LTFEATTLILRQVYAHVVCYDSVSLMYGSCHEIHVWREESKFRQTAIDLYLEDGDNVDDVFEATGC